MTTMQRILILFFLTTSVATVAAQSKSFETLQRQFRGMNEVHDFSVNSFFVNLALKFVPSEEFNKRAFQPAGRVSLLTVPKEHFSRKRVTLDGYERQVLVKDHYEELMRVKEARENVRIYMQPGRGADNRYLVLIDNEEEVVAIEFSGYIDVAECYRQCEANTKPL